MSGGRHRSRDALAAVLVEAGLLDPHGGKLKGAPLYSQRLGHLLMRAKLDAVLASGTPARSPGGALLQTYAAFDERVPAAGDDSAGENSGSETFDRDRALGELAHRYFTSRGPASVKDCAAWSGLTHADVERGLEVAGGLDSAQIEAVELWFPEDPAGPAPEVLRTPRAELIQCYDEYVMGHSQTRHYLGHRLTGTAPGLPSAAVPRHVVLVGGRMAGNWKHTLPQPDRQPGRQPGQRQVSPQPAIITLRLSARWDRRKTARWQTPSNAMVRSWTCPSK